MGRAGVELSDNGVRIGYVEQGRIRTPLLPGSDHQFWRTLCALAVPVAALLAPFAPQIANHGRTPPSGSPADADVGSEVPKGPAGTDEPVVAEARVGPILAKGRGA